MVALWLVRPSITVAQLDEPRASGSAHVDDAARTEAVDSLPPEPVPPSAAEPAPRRRSAALERIRARAWLDLALGTMTTALGAVAMGVGVGLLGAAACHAVGDCVGSAEPFLVPVGLAALLPGMLTLVVAMLALVGPATRRLERAVPARHALRSDVSVVPLDGGALLALTLRL